MTIKRRVREALSRFFPKLRPESYKLQFTGKSPQEIFETIYRDGIWGGRLSRHYHSGSGSRDRNIIEPYVTAVRQFLLNLNRPSVVDLGCGDFYVGSQLVDCAGRFTACDIVDSLIRHNRKKYKQVIFKTLNAIDDELPDGDVVLIRQVLQHLSNAQVAKILPKLTQYRFAVITEHLPGFDGFKPNIDKETGADHRVSFGSGLVLTDPPFNLTAKSSKILCEVEEFGGIIRTIAFEF
jgi:hypothetical protein